MQALHDCSDRETAEAVRFDVRWKVAPAATAPGSWPPDQPAGPARTAPALTEPAIPGGRRNHRPDNANQHR